MNQRKKYSPEEMLHFVHAFASAFDIGAIPAFAVEASKTKNRYFFRIKTSNGDKYALHSHQSYYGEMGTIGGIEKLFKERHPRLMLRTQTITFDELVNEFDLDKYKLAEIVFKYIKKTIDSFIKRSEWTHVTQMTFTACIDSSYWTMSDDKREELKSTAPVSSIDELMVWADLNQGT